ncbi:MAG: leucine-rich repeat domain-containing protein, partial [Clostridia bacterium]|nr:leucine-rich repeat domain-containing protein [Clostridia bacterium]
THTGSQWVVTAYPGCTTTGSQSYLCACGVAVQTAVIPAAGHTEVTDKGVAATCTQSGLTGGTHCSVCSRVVVQQQTIAALGHSIKNEIVAPTSSAQGYTLHTCTICGYAYKDSYTNPTGGEKTGLVYENNRDGTCTVTGYNGAVPEHLVIPQYSDSGAEVTTISNRAFRNQTELKSVTLPTTIRKVEEFAFYNCSGLTAVYGSEHISDIDISAFNDCTALTVIDLSGATAIDDYVLSGCSSLSAVTLCDQLKDLPQGMFANCVALTAVRLPSSLTTIGNSAFQGSGIRQITLPDSVTTISMYAFRYCEALEKITLSKSLKSIAAGVFERCYALNNVVLPSGLESIGRTAFLNCTALTDIRIPDSVNSIGDTCFLGCVGLASAVLPESLTYIPERLFMDCEALKSIAIPTNASKIGMEAFSRTGLTNVSLPNVASIDIGAFSFCSSLQSVDFGDALTTVCSSAFSGCTSLQEAILPDNVTTIGMWAFLNCTGLQKVYLGSNLTDLESAAFEGCTGLKTVFLPKPLEKIAVESYDQNPFTNCSGDLVLYSDIEKANTTLTRYFGLINYGVSYAEYLNIVNV